MSNLFEKVVPGLIVTAIVLLVLVIKVWFFGSLLTSGVKSIAGSCGKNYPVEVFVISGNWFCPKKEGVSNE